METKHTLPQINDLINTDILQLDETNQLNILLNQMPPANWLKAHPTVTVKENNGQIRPYYYLPIERVEYLLTRIFFRWRVEIKNVQLIGNAVVVIVRLEYFNPISDEWEFQDGVGATPLQTDAKAGAIEFDKLKSAAVMMAAPAAESYAIKDAAEKIGAIFGKNLNRADRMSYDMLADNPAFHKKDVADLFDEKQQ